MAEILLVFFEVLLIAPVDSSDHPSLLKLLHRSLAALPIVYLFFIIYSKSTVGQPPQKLKFKMSHPYHNKYIPISSPYPQQMFLSD